MPDVICLGELLIDVCAIERDVSLAEARTFQRAPGGAPANVAVGVVRLGTSAAFIGAVGNDPFGHYLESVLRDAGLDPAGLAKIDDVRTSLVWVAARSDGLKDMRIVSMRWEPAPSEEGPRLLWNVTVLVAFVWIRLA